MLGKKAMLYRNNSKILWLIVLTLLCSLFFILRATGPTDLEGYAQHRNVGYIMDLMVNGNWLAQYDLTGAITSKPPFHTWAMAVFTNLFGVSRTALILPSFLAILGLTTIIFFKGRRYFGTFTGGIAGTFFILAPMTSKHIALVRPDAIFALSIAACAFIAFRAWQTGKGWNWFWLVAAVVTLTKGPLGIVLAASGLLAYFWEKHNKRENIPAMKGSHAWGLVIFFGICLGWFLLAWYQHGQVLTDKLIIDELFGQAAGAGKDTMPGSNLPKPTMYFLSRFAPFSLLTFIGLWRVFKQPEKSPEKRRFERFLTCWLLFGIIAFSLAAHHRADLLFPLWPAGAILAGREAERLMQKMGKRCFSWCIAGIGILLFTYAVWVYHPGVNRRADVIEQSQSVKGAAEALKESDVQLDRVYHVNTPVTLQMYLGTARKVVDAEELEENLQKENGETTPGYIAVQSKEKSSLPFAEEYLEEVFSWTREEDEEPFLQVFKLPPDAF
ncbi:MAG: ArnT family glycosyltransferase [Verrucomicrobiota bacterium]